MSTLIPTLLLIILLLFVVSLLISYFNPKLDWVTVDDGHSRLLLWYNQWEGIEPNRKYKVLIKL